MSNSRRGRPPLVAEPKGPRSRGGSSRTSRKAGRNRTAPKRRGNFVVRFFTALMAGLWRIIWGVTWRVTALALLIVGLASFYFYTTLPEAGELLDGRARGSVTMLDDAGSVFAWRGETFGGQITAENVSPHLRNAVIATEDRRFFVHFGFSPRGIASAMRINMSQGRGPFSGHGGSTITQQVAKLLCLGRAYDASEWESEAAYEAECRQSSVWRKLQELPYAFALEARYSKNEILSIYLSRAYLGAGARGFEAAAQRYFGKSANLVSPAEAAMLAGLLVAPSHFAPTRNLERAQARANVIIGLMEREGYLTAEQAADARANPARLSEAAEQRAGGYFADWIMASGPAFLTRDTTEDVIIATTLNQRIQRAAEEALTEVFENRVRDGSTAQAAIVVMSADGAVRAMVGGRETRVSGGFNRATMAQRQTGSAFKPFVYALAMEMGYEPYDMVEDAPLTLNVPGSGPWTPRNYTNDFQGMMTLTDALAQSVNIPAVRISEAMGREEVRQAANGFGLRSELAEGPALALGASESTLLQMTAAYAGILNGGSAVRPYGLTELTLAGDDSPLMGRDGGIGERVISEEAARRLTWMMAQVVENGTGQRARLQDGREVAGKTGTTQAARDAWFIGFTADYVAGVWMGYDDNTPLTGVTGGGLPAEIWREVMQRVHEGLPNRPLPMIVPDPPQVQEPEFAPWPGDGRDSNPNAPAIENMLRELLGGVFGGN